MQTTITATMMMDDAIPARVEIIWNRIFTASNKAIKDAKNFGFLGMEIQSNPNIHQMLVSLSLLSTVIGFLVTQAEARDDTDSVRLLINSKEQLLRLERLANELRAKNEDKFNAILVELESQAVI